MSRRSGCRGALSAPFAPRSSRARSNTDYPGSFKKSTACRQPYFSLSDPHLQKYFARKAGRSAPSPSPLSPRSAGGVGRQQELARRRNTIPSYAAKRKKEIDSLSQGNEEVIASLDYPVQVFTGDVKGGGTDANVFITLCGSRGCSPKTRLFAEFERGSVVTAHVTSADIGLLESVVMEHDNSGFHSDWFLDKVVVGGGKRARTFFCGQWLSRTEGDGETRRTLTRATEATPPPGHVTYIVKVQTGHMRGAGTYANVFVTLHGDRASSTERRLDNDPANFERERCDVFRLQAQDLGQVQKVILRHNNTGVGPGWYVEWVEVRCEGSEGGEGVRHFPCERWLDASEGGALQCELTPGDREQSKTQQGHRYTVEVTTGTCPGAGTTASVYIHLHGNDTSSGRLWLRSGGCGLSAGQTASFEVLSPCLVSPLETLTVGHDNRGAEPGWFLDKVVVCSGEGGERWVCECGRWLSMDSGDGRIQRELHPSPSPPQAGEGPGEEWLLLVRTSDLRGAGTDATVTVQVHGSLADSAPFPLGVGRPEYFERGEEDVFSLPLPPAGQLGEVTALSLTTDGSGPYPEWHVQHVTLEQPRTGVAYSFTCNRWLSAEHGLSARFPAMRASGTTLTTVTALTSSHTTPTEEQTPPDGGNPLRSQTNTSVPATPIESLATPTLDLSSAVEEGRGRPVSVMDSTITNDYIQQLRLTQLSSIEDSSCGHTPSPSIAPSPHFHSTLPYTVHVKAIPSTPHTVTPHTITTHTVTLPHYELTLFGGKGTSQPIRLESLSCHSYSEGKPEIFSIEAEDVGTISAIKFTLLNGGADIAKWTINEVTVHRPTSGHTYCFPWGQSIESGRAQVIQGVELMSSGSTSLGQSKESGSSALEGKASSTAHQTAFGVKIVTADKKHAGTTNDVKLVIQGTQGASKEFHIKNPTRGPKFQRGQSDSIQVGLPRELGPLTSVRVAHCCRDPSKRNRDMDSSRWFLFQIVLTNMLDKSRYYFLCRQWIAESSREEPCFAEVPLCTSPQ